MKPENTERIGQMKVAMAAFEDELSRRAVSAMPVAISYVARIVRVALLKDGEDHWFRVTRAFTDDEGRKGEQWSDEPRDASVVRDEFLKVKTPSEALDFLSATGEFSPLGDTIRWSEFKLYQRFASLVQEHNQLASAMSSGLRSGEYAEALKALTGIYPSRFFDLPQKPESDLEKRWRKDPVAGPLIREGEAVNERQRRELWTWFREPPGGACSIQWIPKDAESNKALFRKLQAGGAMIEYLVPRETLRPLFLIRARFTLQAIAAAIYADRIQGAEYRTCSVCNSLFRVGAHRDKKYCNREQCKNTAHQRNRRAALRDKQSGTTATSKRRKGGRK
jgi:hypothetical protein